MIRPTRLFFLHLPKTAGTVVHNVLHRNYRKEEQIEINFYLKEKTLEGMSQSQLGKLKLVRGHFPFNIHTQFPSGPFEYCTLLREPLDRCVSHYHYMKARQKNNATSGARKTDSTLLELCTNGERMFLDNLQVRLLSDMYYVPFGKVTDEMLEIAWNNLTVHFPVIGTQEHLNEFLLQLADRYSLRYPLYQSQRVNTDRPLITNLDQPTKDAVLHLNRFDAELYSRVKQMVEDRISAAGPSFESRVKRFARINSIVNNTLKIFPFLFRPKRVTD